MIEQVEWISLTIPTAHYAEHVQLEADLQTGEEEIDDLGDQVSQAEAWDQDKVDYWITSSSDPSQAVFAHLAEVAPEFQFTSEIAAATGLPVPTVRQVFRGLGRRVKSTHRLQGPWPIFGERSGYEVRFSM